MTQAIGPLAVFEPERWTPGENLAKVWKTGRLFARLEELAGQLADPEKLAELISVVRQLLQAFGQELPAWLARIVDTPGALAGVARAIGWWQSVAKGPLDQGPVSVVQVAGPGFQNAGLDAATVQATSVMVEAAGVLQWVSLAVAVIRLVRGLLAKGPDAPA